ncbi:MAG: hypothetical protein WBK77_08700 [Alphaproteobacteria bacterium]
MRKILVLLALLVPFTPALACEGFEDSMSALEAAVYTAQPPSAPLPQTSVRQFPALTRIDPAPAEENTQQGNVITPLPEEQPVR